MSPPVHIGLFAKYPEPGEVKTRLEPLLGQQGCAKLAYYLIARSLELLAQVQCNGQAVKVVLWADGGTEQQWHTLFNQLAPHALPIPDLQLQPQGHLGQRMQHALQWQLAQSGPGAASALVGADAIGLTAPILQHLLHAASQTHAPAFVPALDGGYVAIALQSLHKTVFSEAIDWGTATVMQTTLARLNKAQLNTRGVARLCRP
ncbi:MAG: glycosyltransferase [Limnobacter sp.]|nr:glycosyltransferase [Limnobacter sp.]